MKQNFYVVFISFQFTLIHIIDVSSNEIEHAWMHFADKRSMRTRLFPISTPSQSVVYNMIICDS